MKDNETIQALKNNEKAFGRMTEEMQAKAHEIGIEDFWVYTEFGNTGMASPPVWGKHPDRFTWDSTFCLRPDYAEKPKVVEIPVKIYQGSLHYQGIAGMRALASAPNYADFIGFKYDSGCVSPLPRIYRFGDGMGGSLHYTINCETLAEDDKWEVLTPTHVLFRSQP